MLATARSEIALLAVLLSAAIFYTVGSGWFVDLGDPLKVWALLLWIFVAMLWASFAAVRHADHLAEILGEPYGTLILTIAVISIEISVITAMMLNTDPDPELARDSMFSVVMIVLNLVVGLSLLIGGLRHGEQSFNLQGAQAFLSVLVPLTVVSLILPRFTSSGSGVGLSIPEAVIFCGVALVLYGTFLAIQTGRHRQYFVENGEGHAAAMPAPSPHRLRDGRGAVYHGAVLILLLIPIVLLSEKLAVIVDHGLEESHAPTALGGLLVAVLVLAPEGFAALEAAYRNQLQRAVNVCLGSALATIGLTVPAVLIVGLLTGLDVMLAVASSEMILLALTLFVASLTFSGARTNMLQGMVHLALFVVFVVLIFD